MSAIKRFVRREIISREATFVARVIANPTLLDFDQSASGAPVWVTDIDIGGNRPVRNVPIKADGTGGRFYAQLGQAVEVRRTALGRMYIVGPGDVSIDTLVAVSYDLATLLPVSSQDQGFTRVFTPYQFYMGDRSVKGNPTIDFAVEAGDDSITRDAGSYVDDGLVVGDSIEVLRTIANDGVYSVTGVALLVLTVAEVLVNEAGATSVGLGAVSSSRWNDQTTSYPFSTLVDADGNPA